MSGSLRTIRCSFDWWDIASDLAIYTPEIGESILGWWLDPDACVTFRTLREFLDPSLVHPYNYDSITGTYGRQLGFLETPWIPLSENPVTYNVSNSYTEFFNSSAGYTYVNQVDTPIIGSNRPITVTITQLSGLTAGHFYVISFNGTGTYYSGITINGSSPPALPYTVVLTAQNYSNPTQDQNYISVVFLDITSFPRSRITGVNLVLSVTGETTPAPYLYPNTQWATDSERNLINNSNTLRSATSWQSPLLRVSDAGSLIIPSLGLTQIGHIELVLLIGRNDALEGLAPIELTGPGLGVLECNANELHNRTVFVRSLTRADPWEPNKLYPLQKHMTLTGLSDTGYLTVIRPETNLNSFIPTSISHATTGNTEPIWPSLGNFVQNGGVAFVGYYTVQAYPGDPDNFSYIIENGYIWETSAGTRGPSKPTFDTNLSLILDGSTAWFRVQPVYEWQPNVEYGSSTPKLSVGGNGLLATPGADDGILTLKPGGGVGDALYLAYPASSAVSAHSGLSMPNGWETNAGYNMTDGEIVYVKAYAGNAPSTIIGISKPDREVTFQLVPASQYIFSVTLVDQQNLTSIDPDLSLDDPETGFDFGGVNQSGRYQGSVTILRYDMNIKRWVAA